MKIFIVTNDVIVFVFENIVVSGLLLKEKRKRKLLVFDVRYEKILFFKVLIIRNKGRDVLVICMYNFWLVYLICSVFVIL